MMTNFNARIPTVAALMLLFATADARPNSTNERLLQQDLSADGIRAIVLKGGNGSADVSVGDDDMIRIRVEIRPEKLSDKEPLSSIKSWFLASAYDDPGKLMDEIELDATPQAGGKTKIDLSPSVRSRQSRVREAWHITVPRNISVQLEMADAKLSISDVAGGIDISLGHGSVDVDVPEGDIDIAVTVGKARVRTASQSVGNLMIEAQVGDTNLSMNGMKIQYPDPPGPGSNVSLSGSGNDDIKVYVQVGDASLKVNET